MVLICSHRVGWWGLGFSVCVLGGPGLILLALFPWNVLSWHTHRMSLAPYNWPQEGQSMSPETEINRFDWWWREKRGSGKTYHSPVNMASRGHNKKKSTRTPCLSGKNKTIVKYEMLGICSFRFKISIHLFTQWLVRMYQMHKYWLYTGIQR